VAGRMRIFGGHGLRYLVGLCGIPPCAMAAEGPLCIVARGPAAAMVALMVGPRGAHKSAAVSQGDPSRRLTRRRSWSLVGHWRASAAHWWR